MADKLDMPLEELQQRFREFVARTPIDEDDDDLPPPLSDDDEEEVVEDAISEVVWLTLFKIELEEKCPRVAESGSNLGVVSISSEDVEDRLLLLWSVSLFVLFFEEVWFWEAIEAIEADPPISRPVILLVANMSQRNHFEALQKKIESDDYLENINNILF